MFLHRGTTDFIYTQLGACSTSGTLTFTLRGVEQDDDDSGGRRSGRELKEGSRWAQGRRNLGFTLIEAIISGGDRGDRGRGCGVGLQAAKTPTQTNQVLAANAECVNRMKQDAVDGFREPSTRASNALSGNVTINGTTYTSNVTVANCGCGRRRHGGD